MPNYLKTYIAIAEILQPEDNSLKIKSLIASNKYNWEDIVSIGSKHLVIPAIYYQLKNKNLLSGIPDDLNLYLKDIAQLNFERNLKILNQIDDLSRLLNTSKINHVFLKGSALLKLGLYENIGERMIGDIDILIHKDHIKKSFALLIENGYSTLDSTPGDQALNPKHLPRITSNKEDHICAVELHNRVFENYHYNELDTNHLLLNKNQIDGFSTPNNKHLLMHTILNWQINDKGYLFRNFSFRSSYDALLLVSKHGNLKTQKWLYEKPIQSYFQIISVVFPNQPIQLSKKGSFSKKVFILKFESKLFRKLWYFFSKFFFLLSLFSRKIYLGIKNPLYFKLLVNDFKSSWLRFKTLLR